MGSYNTSSKKLTRRLSAILVRFSMGKMITGTMEEISIKIRESKNSYISVGALNLEARDITIA